MKFNFFNNIYEIKIKKDKKEIKSPKTKAKIDKYVERNLILLITFIIFTTVVSYYTNSIKYEVGKIAQNDIIAHKTIKYEQNILDEELKNKIIRKTNPEYDIKEDVAIRQIQNFKRVLDELLKIDLKNEVELKNFISSNALNISEKDLISLGINGGSKYNIYLVDVLSKIYDAGVVRKSDLTKILSKEQIVLDNYERKFIENFIEPNRILNEIKTKDKINDNIKALKNNVITIHKGDFIVKKGSEITKNDYEKLIHLDLASKNDKLLKIIFSAIFAIVVSILIFLSPRKFFDKTINSKAFYPTLLSFIALNTIYTLFFSKSFILLYLLPISAISIISSSLTKDRLYSLYISTLTNLIFSPNKEWFVIMMIVSVFAIIKSEKILGRIDLVKNGFEIASLQALLAIIYAFLYSYDIKFMIIILLFSLLSGFLTGVICLGIIPYFENTFNILTEIKLLEIGNYSFPLLKRLLLEAPGTFYHSIMVGALAEQAAEAIGANPTLARVGAYYHDIGKLKRPTYFVENQGGEENVHNELKPSLSALLLTSHPRDGYLLGKQYGLPEEVLNIIQEHHGTTMVQYFYYKAVEIGENINESDFKYVGPKPSTKESAIVMLADTVEAAVRASRDKTKEGIESTIRYLIKYKIDDNQLNECGIELKDIEKIIGVFVNVLKAAHHERIQYPKINKK